MQATEVSAVFHDGDVERCVGTRLCARVHVCVSVLTEVYSRCLWVCTCVRLCLNIQMCK